MHEQLPSTLNFEGREKIKVIKVLKMLSPLGLESSLSKL